LSQSDEMSESMEFNLLLDTYEIYKLCTKNKEDMNGKVEFLLTEIYVKFHPDRVRVTEFDILNQTYLHHGQ